MSDFPTREQVLELIEQHAPQRLRQVLVERLRPAIAMDALPVEDVEVGASRFGGAPDVPRGFKWPNWGEKPLRFLAQLDLAEVAPFDAEKMLPPEGWLLFFCDNEDAASWEGEVHHAESHDGPCVFWIEPGQSLERQSPLSPHLAPLALHELGFWIEWQAPLLYGPPQSSSDGLDWEEVLGKHQRDEFDLQQQILGFARGIQYEPELGRNFLYTDDHALTRALGETRLLLQIDGIYAPQMTEGADAPEEGDGIYGGAEPDTIYFCIRRGDLLARRFDRAWPNLQSS